MTKSLKKKTLVGVFWSAIERFSAQGMQFVIQLVLARLLFPSDYGLISMLLIFLQVSQVFIDSGFANALIKKSDCNENDLSTVFWYNLLISILLYIILFVSSPFISAFYETEELVNVLRVISFSLIINALVIVHKTILVKNVNFKLQSIITLSSTFLSGIISICLAYNGFGVWALCCLTLLSSTFKALLYFVFVKWAPRFIFSGSSFKSLFSFGSNLLVSNLINTIYRNLYPLTIGKYYNSNDLGCFSRAEHFAMFPSSNIGSIIIRVIYPVLSEVQDDNKKVIEIYRNSIKGSSYLIFPLMFMLIALSEPMILFLLTERWSGIILMLKILCLDWMLDHISGLNLNLLYIKNRTDLVLRLEIVKKIIAVLILLTTLPYGLLIICWGRVGYSILATFINCFYTERLTGLKFSTQIKDVSKPLFASLIMYFFIILSIQWVDVDFVKLLIGGIVGILIYSLLLFFIFRKDKNMLLQLKTLLQRKDN